VRRSGGGIRALLCCNTLASAQLQREPNAVPLWRVGEAADVRKVGLASARAVTPATSSCSVRRRIRMIRRAGRCLEGVPSLLRSEECLEGSTREHFRLLAPRPAQLRESMAAAVVPPLLGQPPKGVQRLSAGTAFICLLLAHDFAGDPRCGAGFARVHASQSASGDVRASGGDSRPPTARARL